MCYSNGDKKQTSGGTTTSPSVIVIGGGMAGVSAARALHDASIQVPTHIEIPTRCFVH